MQQRSQYGLQQRLPSIDMGIGAIINRPPGSCKSVAVRRSPQISFSCPSVGVSRFIGCVNTGCLVTRKNGTFLWPRERAEICSEMMMALFGVFARYLTLRWGRVSYLLDFYM